MPSTSARTKPKRPKRRVTVELPLTDRESKTERLHGDSYADGSARDDGLAGTTSSHVAQPDRRVEEPSERALDSDDRLEGSL